MRSAAGPVPDSGCKRAEEKEKDREPEKEKDKERERDRDKDKEKDADKSRGRGRGKTEPGKAEQHRQTEAQRLQVMHGLEPVQQLLMLGFLPDEADEAVWADFGTITNGKVRLFCPTPRLRVVCARCRLRSMPRAPPVATGGHPRVTSR